MKKIGLIGGTGPESTVAYYRALAYGVQEKTGRFPKLCIESLSVFEVLRYLALIPLCVAISFQSQFARAGAT